MIKRLLIVLLFAAGIVLAPYYIGRLFSNLHFEEKTIFINWVWGLTICAFVAGGIAIILALYSVFCLVWDYIIGKK